MIDRMLRVFRLDPHVFEEVEHDPKATGQAALVVIIANALYAAGPVLMHFSVFGLLRGILLALIGWVAWAALTFFIGTRLFGGKADLGEMLRVLGFAATPMCLGIVPFVGGLVGAIWAIIAGVIAVRQGLDVTTGKAIVTILLGFVVYVLIFGVLNAVLGGGVLPLVR